jgi:hypothetical protein
MQDHTAIAGRLATVTHEGVDVADTNSVNTAGEDFLKPGLCASSLWRSREVVRMLVNAAQSGSLTATILKVCGRAEVAAHSGAVSDGLDTSTKVLLNADQEEDVSSLLLDTARDGRLASAIRPESEIPPASRLSAESVARTLLDVSRRDQRIGALRASILSAERRLAKQSGKCISLEDQLERTQRELAHLDLDIEWHLRTIRDAETRYEELEKIRERLTEELRIHRRLKLGADLTMLSRANPTPAWGLGSPSQMICDASAAV